LTGMEGIADTGGRFFPAWTVSGLSFEAAIDVEDTGSVFNCFKLSFAFEIPNFVKFFITSVP